VPEKWGKLVPRVIDTKKKDELRKRKENHNDKTQKSQIAWRYDKMKIKFKAFSTRSDYLFLDLSKNLDFSGKSAAGTATDGEKLKDLLV